jgi:hypothetical protein
MCRAAPEIYEIFFDHFVGQISIGYPSIILRAAPQIDPTECNELAWYMSTCLDLKVETTQIWTPDLGHILDIAPELHPRYWP